MRTWLSQIRKLWKFSLGTIRLKNFASYTGLRETVEKLYDLKKQRINASNDL